jgi:hypothetical protein
VSRKVTGADTLEVEVTLSGTYVPGVPEQGPTYACGGQPAEPEMVEDVEVTGLFGQRLVKAPPAAALSHDRIWENVDLLAGVSDEARRQIFANVLAFMDERATEEALMRDLEDD